WRGNRTGGFERVLRAGSPRRWLAPSCRRGTATGFTVSLHHHHKEDAAPVPAAQPAHAPALDAVAERDGCAQPQELGLHRHSHRHAWLRWANESSLAGRRSVTRIERLFSTC